MPDLTGYKRLFLNHVSLLTKNQKKIARHSGNFFITKTACLFFINIVGAMLFIIYSLATGVGLLDRAKSFHVLSFFDQAKIEYEFDVRTDFFKYDF